MPPDTAAFVTGAHALTSLPEASPDGMVVVDTEHCVRYANRAVCAILGCTREDLLGHDFALRFPTHEHHAIRERLAASRSGQPSPWSSAVRHPEGGDCAVEYTPQSCVFDGQQAVVVTVRDVSETRRLARKAAALERIAASMAYAGTLQATLDALACSVVRAIGVSACMVMLIDEQQQRLPVAGTYGLPDGYTAALEAAWRSGAHMHSVQAYQQQRTLIFRNHHQRLLPDPAYAPMHDLLRTVTWDSGACVPLVYQGRSVGTLVGYYPEGAGPDEAELTFLSAIADQAAVAVENARLAAGAQAAAALEERHRLARELHDSVMQALYGIALGVKTAQVRLDRDPGRVAEALDYVSALAATGLAEMRALIFELLPEALETEGLVAALEKQVAAIRGRYEVAISAQLGAEPAVALEVKEAVYRIAQEALHNTVKHAQAHTVHICLEESAAGVLLQLYDDGAGFDTGGTYPGHLGLRTMRERATRLGGTLEVESAPGAGTRIRARIPSRAAG